MVKLVAKLIILIFFIPFIIGCGSGNFDITPIDKEMNTSLWSLEGMDQRLFDTRIRLQYFEVSDYKELKSNALKDSLTKYIDKSYPLKKVSGFKEVGFFFYQKSALNAYDDKVFLAARDSENGLIEGDNDKLIAQVWFTKLAEHSLVRRTLIFDGHAAVLDKQDTLHIDVAGVADEVKNNTVVKGEVTAKVAENHCLSVNADTEGLNLRRCYEVDFIEVRKVNKTLLSLTFISGKNAIDLDFYPIKEEWVAKELTFFGATTANKKGVNSKQDVKLKTFNFANLAEKFLGE